MEKVKLINKADKGVRFFSPPIAKILVRSKRYHVDNDEDKPFENSKNDLKNIKNKKK